MFNPERLFSVASAVFTQLKYDSSPQGLILYSIDVAKEFLTAFEETQYPCFHDEADQFFHIALKFLCKDIKEYDSKITIICSIQQAKDFMVVFNNITREDRKQAHEEDNKRIAKNLMELYFNRKIVEQGECANEQNQ